MTSPIRVKFLSRVRLPNNNVGDDFLRRFPNREPILGNCHFIFDHDCQAYDWLVVYDDLPRDYPMEMLECPRENTLLITGEPSSITHYGRSFLKQFGHVLTSQEPWALQHPSVIRQQAGLYWYYGGLDERGAFDSLVSTPPIKKHKLISSVCSTKAMRHTMHAQRLAFTRRLMTDISELEVFGYGMADLANKADAIDPYRYHLVIENHSCPHHWTEKLADAFLGYALPIYFGCTNLDDYFPKDSYIWIDIQNYDESLERIRCLVSNDEYQARLPSIIEARRRVLHEYSTFAQLSELVETHHRQINVYTGGSFLSRRLARKGDLLSWPSEFIAKFNQKIRLRGK
jgi:hypothetical protein